MTSANGTPTISMLFAAVSMGALAMGCAVSTGYINKGGDVQQNVVTWPSNTHDFKYVRLYYDDGALVVYGKVVHSHADCHGEVRVEVAFHGSDGTLIESVSLPLRNQGSYRPGWRGAAFRARFRQQVPDDATIRLAFQDSGCATSHSYHRRAYAAVGESWRAVDHERL